MLRKTFWFLDGPADSKKLADWDDDVEMETVRCAVNAGHQRAGRRLGDLSVTLPGTQIDDFVWTWGSACLIQDHVLQALKQQRFTGFEVRPVRARFRIGTDAVPPILWELIVLGWGGIASTESGIALVDHCNSCQYLHYSNATKPDRLMDATQWDGSDFFIIWPIPKFIMVSSRVVRTIRESNWTGVFANPLSEIKFGGSGFSPGRLSYVMPADRAKNLGGALGIA